MTQKADLAQKMADGAVGVSWTGTALAWLTNVNDILQFVALATSIVAAIYAIRVHRKKLREMLK